MAYAKVNIDTIMATGSPMTIRELIAAAIADHSRTNGCTFEDGAAETAFAAFNAISITPYQTAHDLTEDPRIHLAHILESLETHCAGKDMPNVGVSISTLMDGKDDLPW